MHSQDPVESDRPTKRHRGVHESATKVPTATPATYTYSLLTGQVDGGHIPHIRILELDPAVNEDAPLSGCLHTEHFDTASDSKMIAYEALSYVWGDSTVKSGQLCIFGLALSIGAALDTALRYFRLRETTRRLWIDAVCINQNDDAEKTSQVRLMTKIYAHARRTLSWLGEAQVGDAVALQFLDWFALAGSTISQEWGRVNRVSDKLSSRFIFDLYHSKTNGDITDLVARLEALFHRPYFTRKWIVQEIGVASEVQFWCSHLQIDGAALSNAAMELIRDDLPFSVTAPSMRLLRLRTTVDISKVFGASRVASDYSDIPRSKDGSSIGVLGGLESFRQFQCRDARDHIASMTWMDTCCPFAVDYHLSVEDNYLEFATSLASVSQATLFFLLSSAARRQYEDDNDTTSSSTSQTPATLPSWVPDWRKSPRVCRASYPSNVFRSEDGAPKVKIHLLRPHKCDSGIDVVIDKGLGRLELKLDDFASQERELHVLDAGILEEGDCVLKVSAPDGVWSNKRGDTSEYHNPSAAVLRKMIAWGDEVYRIVGAVPADNVDRDWPFWDQEGLRIWDKIVLL